MSTRRVRLGALLLAALLLARPAGAQEGTRVIEGRVTRAASGGRTIPVVGDWVVLHRVGADAAAPIDSMRTRAGGAYAFRYRATGDSAAVYFVSTSWGGVAYFTPPTTDRAMRGGAADLMVFDTTSAQVPITIRARHLIVTSPDSANGRVRTVIEVFELSNDSTATRVPGAEGRYTFRSALPDGVRQVTGGQGGVSPEAIRVEEGEVRVYAPIAPGLKQISFIYELPATTATMRFPFEGSAPVLEVLVEDPRATAVGGGLVEVNPVAVEGRPFKRFLAEDVAGPDVIAVTAPGPASVVTAMRLMLVVTGIGAAMLLALGMIVLRKGPGAFGRRRAADPEAIARKIAALDAAFEALAVPDEDARRAHYVHRAQLKGQLSAALAKRDGLA